MDMFTRLQNEGAEQLSFWRDSALGIKAAIAIHNTELGPAVAGVRVVDYPDEQAMVTDALDMAQEMTLRAALAGCDLGGGSIVLSSAPTQELEREAFFRSLGRYVESRAGELYAVMEVGTDEMDMRNVKRETDYVLALPTAHGGIADPTQITADGVVLGIKAAVKHLHGEAKLANVTCLVQGLGRLGAAVTKQLAAAGARLLVTDLNYDKIKDVQDIHPNIGMVHPREVLGAKCDVLIPCAVGNIITRDTVEGVRAKIIAGGASNILPDFETADVLHQRGVLYAPHFVIDAGELMQADCERRRWSFELLQAKLGEIYGRTLELLEAAREAKKPPVRLSVERAEQRIAMMCKLRRPRSR